MKIKMEAEEPEKFDVIPPEIEYMSARYTIHVPVTDRHFENPWKLRLFAAKLLERRIGDQIQLTSLKVKKPGPAAKAVAKLRHQIPNAQLRETIKF